MTDVFISYAREDRDFVRSLFGALEERERDAWVDWEGIPPTAEWLEEIYSAIDAADTFLFVMSPDSLASKNCLKEVDHAANHNKRLVPVVWREAEDPEVPDALAKLNWIFLREDDDFTAGIDMLIEALDTDFEHVKLHTRYLKRAVDWQRKSEDKSFVLRGQDLGAAEAWLASSGEKQPRPTSLHNRYILESRSVTTRRQRITSGAIAFGLLVAVVLGLLAIQERNAKRLNHQRSIANQLVGESRLAREEREDALGKSVQLAAEAMRRLDALGERSLAADQELRLGLALSPAPPETNELESPGEIRAAAFSPRGRHLAVATSLGNVRVWDALKRALVGSWKVELEAGDTFRQIAVTDSGDRAATWLYADGTSRITLWEVSRGVELGGCDREGDFKGRSFELGPKGRLVADRVWRLPECQEIELWDASLGTLPLTLSDDGSRVFASYKTDNKERWIEARDLETGAVVARWRHEQVSTSLQLLDEGRRLASVAHSRLGFQVWEVKSPRRPQEIELPEPVISIRGDGRRAATQKRDSSIVKIFDTDGGELLRLVHPKQVETAAFSPDGRYLTTFTLVDHVVRRWQLTAGSGVAADGWQAEFEDRAPALDLAAGLYTEEVEVHAAIPCPDETRRAVTVGTSSRGGWQASTDLWDTASRERLVSFDLVETVGEGMKGIDDHAIGILACSDDGRFVATPSRDAIVVRETATGRLVGRLRHPGLHTAVFAPGGDYAATAGRGPVRMWQVASTTEVARLLDDEPVEDLAFSADGKYLATRGKDGVRVHLWQPRDLIAEVCARIEGNLPEFEWQLLFPDDPYVATCSSPVTAG